MTEIEVIEKLERENITLAPISKRFLAHVIDMFLINILINIMYPNSFENFTGKEEEIILLLTLIFTIVFVHTSYQTFFVYMYGATLGKMVMKIKVVSIYDLENPLFIHSLIRGVMRNISEIILFLGFYWAFMNSKKETWHDKAGRTLVVNAF